MGSVNRVTILRNKDKSPKGFAYIEFNEEESVEIALAVDRCSVDRCSVEEPCRLVES